jgi:hypothetical protein
MRLSDEAMVYGWASNWVKPVSARFATPESIRADLTQAHLQEVSLPTPLSRGAAFHDRLFCKLIQNSLTYQQIRRRYIRLLMN